MTSWISGRHFARVNPAQMVSGELRGFFITPAIGRCHDPAALLQGREGWFDAMRNGTAWTILDHSVEGFPHNPVQSAAWHRHFESIGVPASRFVFITQDRPFRDEYGRWCDAEGLTDRFAVLTYDAYPKMFFSGIGADGPRQFAEGLAAFEAKTSVERRFVSLNFKLRPYRIALLTSFLRDGLWDDGFISCGGMEQEAIIDRVMKARGMQRHKSDPVGYFLQLPIAGDSKDFVDELLAKGEVVIGNPSKQENGLFNMASLAIDREVDIYQRSWFSVVMETDMFAVPSRVTEKPFKVLASFHPFILIGNPGSLALIRDFGFKTFSPWIDESYDLISDPNERFRQAYREFLRFRDGAGDLILNDKGLRDVIIYNAEHALTRMPAYYEDVLDRKLCEQLYDIAA